MTRRQTEWRDRVERWRASGLSAEEFAREEGVKAGTLRHWAWYLGRQREKASERSAFVEVVTTVSSRELEIVVRDEVRIRVPPDFDEATLRRVLAIMEGH
jgi:hypothetical protein